LWALVLLVIARTYLSASTLNGGLALCAGGAVVLAAFANLWIAKRLGWDLARIAERVAIGMRTPMRTFILMVIVAPVCEEFIFRGFLFQLFSGYGIIIALAATTILFTIAHTDLASAPHLIAAGLLFGILTVVSGGLATPIIAHSIANLIGFVALQSALRVQFRLPPGAGTTRSGGFLLPIVGPQLSREEGIQGGLAED
jgi:membrane protease YdiL (CAAX protease family)